ncbi:MAG: flagellar protein FlgN [Alphaproteobacteria bacterium]|nr:flagellar protein FlgN [Alphaproteobacteria bacterium]
MARFPKDHIEQNTESRKQAHFLSQDPEQAMQEMMESIDTLRAVYQEETEALITVNTQAFLDLQTQKLEAARTYQQGIEEILERREEMQNVNPLTKKRLAEMQKNFSTLSEQNMEALKRMQRTMDRLSQTIRKAAKDAAHKQRAFSYGENGTLQSDNGKIVSTGISETA